MQRPWTEEEDQLLRDGVKIYGCQWAMVQAHMQKKRSIESILRRWNRKIRYEKYRPRKSEQGQIGRELSLNNKIGQDTIFLPAKREYYQPCKPTLTSNQNEVNDQEVEENWKKAWTEREDKKLKLLAIQSGVLGWKTLAETLEADIDETKLRWKRVIYPNMIKQGSKVGGSLKWSVLQDKILNFGFKQGIDWQEEGRLFLPSRSLGSIEARWRRVAKYFEASCSKVMPEKHCKKRKRSKLKQTQTLEQLKITILEVKERT